MERVTCILSTVVDWLKDNEGLLTALATIVIAAFTIALARSTKRLWAETQASSKIAEKSAAAALETAKYVTVTERAYAKMSHRPPGLHFEPGSRWWVQMRIQNFGRTPARITARCINAQYFSTTDTPPSTPDYSGGVIDTVGAFLAPNDHVSNTVAAFFPSSQIESAVRTGQGRFLIFGYIDYIDQFGGHHRAGYGREYSASLDDPAKYPPADFPNRSNLAFVPEPNYNYDRERNRDEGNDWEVPN